MRVWIDQAECMGAGTCAEIAPDVFTGRRDGVWVVMESAAHFGSETIFDGSSDAGHGPDGARGVARVPVGQEELVLEAAEDCSAACVYVEV